MFGCTRFQPATLVVYVNRHGNPIRYVIYQESANTNCPAGFEESQRQPGTVVRFLWGSDLFDGWPRWAVALAESGRVRLRGAVESAMARSRSSRRAAAVCARRLGRGLILSHSVFGGLFPPNVHEPPFIREEKVSSRPIPVIHQI
ncbi:hypothetical protein RM96_35435 [Cupriavidus sp. IDO]|nr:hypothetical protein RM96_35435 [Cupriavidus sp. IDO]